MHLFLLSLSSLLLVRKVAGLDKLQYCGDSVQSATSSFTFAGDTVDDYWANICVNDLGIFSMGAAVKIYCSDQEILPSWSLLQEYCTEGEYNLTAWDIVSDHLTDDFIKSLQVVQFEDIDATKTWNNSVLISENLFKASYRTSVVFEWEYKLHQYYGWSIYAFWGIILLFGMTQKLFRILLSRNSQGSGITEESGGAKSSITSNSPIMKLSSWIYTHLVVPATVGTYHQSPLWWCTIPTRIESIVVISFYILNFVLCCVSYEIFYPNLYYTEPLQIWRYVADRTGIISYACLPWLWMFSGRNNIFIWLTGWSFGTFNVFHRHIARVATVQAIVHSIAYTAIEINYHELAAAWKEEYWYMGGMATIVMSLLLVLSSLWVRKMMYEVFLLIHIAFAVLTIVGLFYHTAIWDGEYDGYLWPLVAIWLFDRFARLARLIYCNVHLSYGNSQLQSDAEVVYNKNAHVLELKISPRASHLRPAAGQHYFIYQPAGWKLWENHPFTLASWTSLRSMATSISLELPTENVEKSIASLKGQGESSQSSTPVPTYMQTPVLPTSEALIFYVRPHDSWTRRLQASCLKSSNLTIHTKMSIEGPYGEAAPLHMFENVIFVIGGSGITAAMPYLQEFIANRDSSSHRIKEVTFVWTTKQRAMIQDIIENNLWPLLRLDNVQCYFHATSNITAPQPDAQKGATANGLDFEIDSVRPDIRAHISNAVGRVADAGRVGGRVAVFSCGPAAMADETRASVHGTLQTHKGQVDVRYFEETFGWS